MAIENTIHTSNIEAVRRAFLDEIAKAAPRDDRTTYAQWDAAVKAYLDALRPWLKDEDLQLWPRPEYCALPGSSLPFSVYGYAYFRAWLRKRHLDPEDFRPDQPRL